MTSAETVAGLAEVLAGHVVDLRRFGCGCGQWIYVKGSGYFSALHRAHVAAVVLAHLEAQGWVQGRDEWGFSLSVYAQGNVARARNKERAELAANAWPDLDPKLYRRRVSEWVPVETGDRDE